MGLFVRLENSVSVPIFSLCEILCVSSHSPINVACFPLGVSATVQHLYPTVLVSVC